MLRETLNLKLIHGLEGMVDMVAMVSDMEGMAATLWAMEDMGLLWDMEGMATLCTVGTDWHTMAVNKCIWHTAS